MRKWITMINLLVMVVPLIGADLIVTKTGSKYQGKVIKIIEKGFVVRTVEGTVHVIPKSNLSKIYRGNKVLDFEENMSYYLEVRRPFLPFIVLGLATGAFSVKNFQDYRKHRDQYDQIQDESKSDYLKKSNKELAYGIVSGLFSVGSFYIALRPMEVKVPIGRISLQTLDQGIQLSLHF